MGNNFEIEVFGAEHVYAALFALNRAGLSNNQVEELREWVRNRGGATSSDVPPGWRSAYDLAKNHGKLGKPPPKRLAVMRVVAAGGGELTPGAIAKELEPGWAQITTDTRKKNIARVRDLCRCLDDDGYLHVKKGRDEHGQNANHYSVNPVYIEPLTRRLVFADE